MYVSIYIYIHILLRGTSPPPTPAATFSFFAGIEMPSCLNHYLFDPVNPPTTFLLFFFFPPRFVGDAGDVDWTCGGIGFAERKLSRFLEQYNLGSIFLIPSKVNGTSTVTCEAISIWTQTTRLPKPLALCVPLHPIRIGSSEVRTSGSVVGPKKALFRKRYIHPKKNEFEGLLELAPPQLSVALKKKQKGQPQLFRGSPIEMRHRCVM